MTAPDAPGIFGGCGDACGCDAGGKPAPERAERLGWRSLEELAGTDEARAFREREFPVGASELPDGIDRRSFVQLIGASLSLAGLAACRRPVETIVPYVTPPEELLPGIAKRYATTMPFGIGGYGLVVESHEGRPTKIEGNELHPATRGATSAQMQAAILGLYDPDRSRFVLQKSSNKEGDASGEAGGERAAGSASEAPSGFEKRAWADFVAAWKGLEEGFVASGGAGLAVLALPSASPTLFRLAGAFVTRFPQAKWVAWEPSGAENSLIGAQRATGAFVRVTHDLAAAKAILSLDADLFLGENEAVVNARGFAAGRELRSESDSMNRLWVVESALSTTGAMADHRLAVPSSKIEAVAGAVMSALARRGVAEGAPAASIPETPGVPPAWIEAVASDLAANRGSSVVVAGRDQPAAVHAAALLLNTALGNVGTTVLLRSARDLVWNPTSTFGDLVAAMNAGAISTLVVLGANPVYDAPADFDFAAAASRVGNIVHLGPAFDETAARSHWHLPEAHFLEAWGDCRAADGTASVVQPMIEPLFGGKSAIEVARLLATGEEQSGYDAVRESWSAIVAESGATTDFDTVWNQTLHDGLLAGSALAPLTPPSVSAAILAHESGGTPAPGSIELVFRASPAVHDGRFANCGWLQELPDATSKLTWGNAALLSPRTASRLGVENEDGVKLSANGATVELPAWIVPGQADETVVVHLGYGRTGAGRIGNGVGVSVYPLRTSANPSFLTGVTIERSGTKHRLAQTQDHGSMEGRPIVREATLEEWRHEPRFADEMVEVPKSAPLWEQHKYDQGPQWAMTIDLNSCTGCNACVVACQSENNVPIVGHEQVRRGREMHWLRLDRYFTGSPESPEVSFQPVPCMQCENAPCEQVCPVAATVHSADGLNAMVYNRCIGTRYCSNNCPYKVRRFNFFNFTKDTPELLKLAANPDVTVRSRGVMEKCTYCVQRIQAAKIDAKMAERPIADGDVKTACQQACPTQAIVFGDQLDAESQIVERKGRSRNYVLLAELGNKPRTSYLARIRNPHPDLARDTGAAEAHG